MTATLTPAGVIAERVDAYLADYLDAQAHVMAGLGASGPDLLTALRPVLAKGKRTRAALCWWGHEVAAGVGGADVDPDDPEGIVAAASAVELFHAAALVHDDIIDRSDRRRGLPTTHVSMAAWHGDRGLSGDAEDFGLAGGIIAGDLCLGMSEDLFSRCRLGADSPAVTGLRRSLRTDVMVGQYLDVLAQAERGSPRDIQDRAWEVLTLKTAKYSVQQPLMLGAALGQAPPAVLEALSDLGLPLGQAYQLRDDLLGVFGDQSVTGKPAGDDLRDGKRTLLLGYALEDLDPADAEELSRGIGNADADVARLQGIVLASGAVERVEAQIDALVARSREGQQGLIDAGAAPDQVAELARFATFLVDRTS